MEAFAPAQQIQFWPVILGWIVVCCMYLFGWQRQAIIATLGMIIVTLFVIAASRG